MKSPQFLMLSALLAGSAAAVEEKPLSLESFLRQVEADAPPIQVQAAQVGVSERAVGTVGTWEDPEISIMTEDFAVGSQMPEQEEMRPMFTSRVDQRFTTLWGRRKAEKDAARGIVFQDRARLRRTVWDLKAEAAMIFWDLWMSHEMEKVMRKQLRVMKRMLSSAEARYASGMMMVHHDVLRTDAQIKRMQAQLSALGARRKSLEAMANYLRNQPPETSLGIPVLDELEPLPPLDGLLGQAVRNPEVTEAEGMLRESEARKRVAKSMAAPMLMGSLFYQNRTGEMPDSVGGMIGLSVPVFYRDKQRNEILMSEAMIHKADLEIAAMTSMAAASVQKAYFQAVADETELKALTSEALPLYRETVNSAEAEYVSGKGQFLILLEALNALLDQELQRISGEVTVRSARFRLSQILGSDVEERP